MSYWLSFCDPARPEGQQFLGGCVVDGVVDMVSATKLAWALGINPGGEVNGVEIPPERDAIVAKRWRERLLTREECDEMDRELMAIIRGDRR